MKNPLRDVAALLVLALVAVGLWLNVGSDLYWFAVGWIFGGGVVAEIPPVNVKPYPHPRRLPADPEGHE